MTKSAGNSEYRISVRQAGSCCAHLAALTVDPSLLRAYAASFNLATSRWLLDLIDSSMTFHDDTWLPFMSSLFARSNINDISFKN